jgi:hypothetical protein
MRLDSSGKIKTRDAVTARIEPNGTNVSRLCIRVRRKLKPTMDPRRHASQKASRNCGTPRNKPVRNASLISPIPIASLAKSLLAAHLTNSSSTPQATPLAAMTPAAVASDTSCNTVAANDPTIMSLFGIKRCIQSMIATGSISRRNADVVTNWMLGPVLRKRVTRIPALESSTRGY